MEKKSDGNEKTSEEKNVLKNSGSNVSEYVRTDLAAEGEALGESGVKVREYQRKGFSVHEILAENEGDGVCKGRYITVTVGPLWLYGKENVKKAEDVTAGLLSEFVSGLTERESLSVLTVCLGNRRITSDAVGPLCADKLIVTRHLKTEKKELFESFGKVELSVISPGVTGETGVETLELIKTAVDIVKPDLVLCVDALAARSVDRLATTVQITDTGISPGSGVGNHRKEISLRTVGVPVISIGVPTVVQSSTLVFDALGKAGITDIEKPLRDVLENEKSFFVTPKNTDVAVSYQAELIAKAINRVFLGFDEL